MDNVAVVFIEELVYQLMTRDPHDKPSADHVRATLHSALPQIKCKSSPHCCVYTVRQIVSLV